MYHPYNVPRVARKHEITSEIAKQIGNQINTTIGIAPNTAR